MSPAILFLRRSCLILGILLCSTFCCGVEFKIEKIFDTKDQGGDYKHPASFTELANGDLFLSFYGGGGEYVANTADWGARLVKGQKKWSQPKVIADTPFISDGNPVVWQAPDGLVWLFYVVRYGDTWSDSVIMAKVSSDKAFTWSDPIIIAAEKGMMVRSQPIVLNNGDYLLPIYHECGGDREEVTPETMSLFLRIDPKTKTWKETNRIKGPTGVLQPSVVQLDDNHLIAYMRRGGGYEEDIRDYIYKAESNDGGYTWSDAVATEFPNPNAAIDLLKLKSGNLLLVYNDSFMDRNPLTVTLSTDQGKTWGHKKNIIDKNEDYAYPYVIQTKDGKIHLIFTSHERTQVNRCVFTEEDLLK